MKVLLLAALVAAVSLTAASSPPVEDWQLYRPGTCRRSTFPRNCQQISGNCQFDEDCKSGAACCDQWNCNFGRCTRTSQPHYDWQKNRPGICRKASYPPVGGCGSLTQTCDYDWECERGDGRVAYCCDNWNCNIGRCTLEIPH